jgi:hypothetical protein
MKGDMYNSDQDGKSKTASAVDQEHYPEQNEVEISVLEADSFPGYDHIAARAFELWHARGCPDGSAEQDWLEAEAELQARRTSQSAQGSARRNGSVQH